MKYPFQQTLPVLVIKNTVLFPGITLPLRIGRPKSVAAVEKASTGNPWLITVTQTRDEGDEPSASGIHSVGTLSMLEQIRGSAESGYQIVLKGVARVQLRDVRESDGFIQAEGEECPDRIDSDPKTAGALLQSLRALSIEMLELLPANTEQLQELVRGIDDLGFLANICAANLEISMQSKQEVLETVSVRDRVLKLLDLMQTQKESLVVQGEIRNKLSHKIGRLQRENILREQLRTIREELGEGDESVPGDDLRAKVDAAGMPEDVRKTALQELKRLETMGPASPESHVIRNYLDLLVALPWSKSSASASGTSAGEIDLEKAREILENDHYGMQKVKKRILQHLAVMKLRKSGSGSILCLVGPPGVGKTSLGQSIARALGRKFVRGSLGGVRDDAEIRGHRRTYVGAMPGRIIQGIKKTGENDPVFLLDEIDKLARSFNGDPASALLEVLDPEQNSTFLDHYLDVPFDLSSTFFIATANSLETIPGPLLDRMEVIELSGYTTAEKLHIAKRHLLPKQLEAHGLDPERAQVSDEALLRIITHYSREAGVRELQRVMAALCRGIAEKVLTPGAESPVRIELHNVEELLGPEKFSHEAVERIAPPGVVTGLAWTPVGGEILFVEAGVMPGSGKLTLTGQLGDVMKESTQIALSLVRSKLSPLMPGFAFEKNDIHVHVPAGAIPKDGPSAGVTMLVALASIFSGRSVDPKLAMTGEITLRGAVMPVGGVKEKVIAAHRAGIERILLPKRNQKDLAEVPDEVKERISFEFVENAKDVLKAALGLDLVELNVVPPLTNLGPKGSSSVTV